MFIAFFNLLATFSECLDTEVGLDQCEIARERLCYESEYEFNRALLSAERWVRTSWRKQMLGDGLTVEVHWYSRPRPGVTGFLFPASA